MKMAIRRKIGRGLVLILTIVLSLEMVNLYAARRAQQELEQHLQRDLQTSELLVDLERDTALAYAGALAHAAAPTIEQMEQSELQIATREIGIADRVMQLSDRLSRPAERDLLAEFRTTWDLYARLRTEQALPASTAGRKDEAMALLQTGAAGLAAHNALVRLQELQEMHRSTHDALLRAALGRYQTTHYALLAAVIALVIPVLAFGRRLSARVSGPIETLSTAAELVATGDVDWTVTLDTGDELERLAESFNRMTRVIRRLTAGQREAVSKLANESAERQRAWQAVDATRERMALALDALDAGVVAIDAQGRVLFLNATAARLTGWAQDQVGGCLVEQVLRVAPGAGSGSLPQEGWPQRVVIESRLGGALTVICARVAMPSPDGAGDGALLVLRALSDTMGGPERSETLRGTSGQWIGHPRGRRGDILW